ncbi:MAG: hypothetical protein EZS28_021251 [Streblomastix strix]|uniref:Uncharacterized protein n=1 Tax=Streblomastix strix TaxID=222440 RepID=A0A5J4VKW5_9EUKA|nr:MAG: hypothetical protein EZS28_021251 [Streblomastix strix]
MLIDKIFEHFDKRHQAIKQADFYDNLLTFFKKRNISQANLQVVPITEAKKDTQKVNKLRVDNFVDKYLIQLKQGMEFNFAVDYKFKELSEFDFNAQLKAICNYERKYAPNSQFRVLCLQLSA